VNGTPVDWFSKRQSTVETASYGSKFMAARIAVDQIIDLRISLRYLRVPVNESTFMFGDNQSVVKSSTIPTSALNKRHNALSYHRVREAIAAGIIKFFHINGKDNPADVLSKHCGYQDAWPKLQPFLFWKGSFNTKDAPEQPDGEYKEVRRGTSGRKSDHGPRKAVSTAIKRVTNFLSRSGRSGPP